MKIIIIIIVIILIVFAVLYFKNNQNLSMTITPEELTNGRYYGDENDKKEGTPDDWTLVYPGTRGAMWVSPENLTDKQ